MHALLGEYAPGLATRMKGSSIVDEPREYRTPCARESKEKTGRVLERKWFLTTASISRRAKLERRTGNVPGELSEEFRAFGWADAGSDPSFTAHQGLHHLPQFSSFLHDVTFKKRRFGRSN